MDDIETSRLVLRRPRAGDAEALFSFFVDVATNRHNPSGPWRDVAAVEATLAATAEHWSVHGFGPWIVSRNRAPHEIIGYGGIRWRDFSGTEKLNLGYRFAPSAWGKGFATELALEAIRLSFSGLGADAVWALVRPTNTESIRVLVRAGMTRFGTEDDVPGEPPSLIFRILHPLSDPASGPDPVPGGA